jgi:hypothetical protein
LESGSSLKLTEKGPSRGILKPRSKSSKLVKYLKSSVVYTSSKRLNRISGKKSKLPIEI